jgi:quinol monooxygenase YgiN
MSTTAGPLLAHNVFFSLHDRSPEAADRLVAACEKYLTRQPGIVHFACGRLEPGLDRPVNVLDWDVGLHIIFSDRAAHDAYQIDPQHQQFVDENKPTWRQVRVFDSLVRTHTPGS